jgi:hypothetical protein
LIRIISILGGILFLSVASHAKQINDNLVAGLDCQNISVREIYSHIRSDAYSVDYQIPVRNWNFSFLANCWSMSHSQRLIFMLSRINSGAALGQTQVRTALNMIRGSVPDVTNDEIGDHLKEFPLPGWSVFETDRGFSQGSTLFGLMQDGFEEPLGSLRLARNFQQEVQTYQVARFFRPGNIDMGLGQWERAPNINEASVRVILKNAHEHRLTLVDLRGDRNIQHVVVIKKFEVLASGKYLFHVYDSNFPDREGAFDYDPAIQQFNGGTPMGAFYNSPYLDRPVGLFVVDEKDHHLIDKALMAHYKQSCH